MSETVNAAIGYVDDIPMPKVVQHPALFTVAPMSARSHTQTAARRVSQCAVAGPVGPHRPRTLELDDTEQGFQSVEIGSVSGGQGCVVPIAMAAIIKSTRRLPPGERPELATIADSSR